MIYKTKLFAAQIKKSGLSEEDLKQACSEMKEGLIEADLGGNLYKKRISKSSKGKRGGYRTVIGALIGNKYFFLYAFAKNKKSNITIKEKLALRELTKFYLRLTNVELEVAVTKGELIIIGDTNE